MADVPQWTRVKELFHAVVDVDPAAQTQWLHEHAGDDEALLAELSELLAAHRGDSLAPVREASNRPDPWRGMEQVGAYRICRELARGGMGRVFEATREQPRRR